MPIALQEAFSKTREKSAIDKEALLELSETLKEQVCLILKVPYVFLPLGRSRFDSFDHVEKVFTAGVAVSFASYHTSIAPYLTPLTFSGNFVGTFSGLVHIVQWY